MPDARAGSGSAKQSVYEAARSFVAFMNATQDRAIHFLVQRNNVEQTEQNTVDPVIIGKYSGVVCMLPEQHWGESGDLELTLGRQPF